MEFTVSEKEEMLLFIENEILMANKYIERIQSKINKSKSYSDLYKRIVKTQKRIDSYKYIANIISK